MFNRLFVLKLFDAFSIIRWNDKIRPFELTEMDKNGFKMILTYFIGKEEEVKGKVIDWEFIIYAGFFDLLKKIVLSDIKADVHHRIKQKYKDDFKELNNWVVDQYLNIIDDKKLITKFRDYLLKYEDLDDINYRIIKAAHKYSTCLEFEIVYGLNLKSKELESCKKNLNDEINQFKDLEGIKNILKKNNLYELICLIHQLRYQIRWSQTPRIPQTSVLGHSMLVACLSLLISRDLNSCKKRLFNNFYGGLFHDLPESVTRDIISPVKRSTKSFPNIIKKIEKEILDENLWPLVNKLYLKELKYLIESEDEFFDRIILEDRITTTNSDEIQEDYNFDKYNPFDGSVIKFCDEVSAFLEAYESMEYGINSTHLRLGHMTILNHYLKKDINIVNINTKKFFLEFV